MLVKSLDVVQFVKLLSVARTQKMVKILCFGCFQNRFFFWIYRWFSCRCRVSLNSSSSPKGISKGSSTEYQFYLQDKMVKLPKNSFLKVSFMLLTNNKKIEQKKKVWKLPKSIKAISWVLSAPKSWSKYTTLGYDSIKYLLIITSVTYSKMSLNFDWENI